MSATRSQLNSMAAYFFLERIRLENHFDQGGRRIVPSFPTGVYYTGQDLLDTQPCAQTRMQLARYWHPLAISSISERLGQQVLTQPRGGHRVRIRRLGFIRFTGLLVGASELVA